MRVYVRDQRYGHDRVVWRVSPSDTISIGDVILLQGRYMLALGKDQSLALSEYELQGDYERHLAESGLFGAQSISLMHWMVREWYSSYHRVVPLWYHGSIEDLLKRKSHSKQFSPDTHLTYNPHAHTRLRSDTANIGQQCIIFPDLRTLRAQVPEHIRTNKQVLLLSSTMTEKQRNDAFWKIKMGTVSVILGTSVAMFQDRYQLHDIHIVDPHMRYYKHRQNPKYVTYDVIQYMTSLYELNNDTDH